MNDLHNGVNSILNHYDLAPTSVSQHGRVVKVKTSRGTYALKSLPFEKEAQFLDTQNILHRKSISTLPIFLTKYGEPLVRTERQCFYLTPWVEELSRQYERKWENLMDAVARLHRRTKNEKQINGSDGQRHDQNDWEAGRFELEKFVFQAEHQPYPSPFEQRILLLFHRIMADAEHAHFTNETLRKSEESDAALNQVVLCHGSPKIEHFVMFDRGAVLINFDHAHWGSSVEDLADIFMDHRIQSEYVIRLYNQYQTANQLTLNEKRRLKAELLWPDPFVQLVKKYREQKNVSELIFIDQLHDICLRRQNLQLFFDYLDKEISEESNPPSDPSLEETNIESNEQNENHDIKSRRPENGSDHLENGEG